MRALDLYLKWKSLRAAARAEQCSDHTIAAALIRGGCATDAKGKLLMVPVLADRLEEHERELRKALSDRH